jgi:hypothetical protein
LLQQPQKLETREYSGPLRHHSTCRRGSAANFQSDTSAFMETTLPGLSRMVKDIIMRYMPSSYPSRSSCLDLQTIAGLKAFFASLGFPQLSCAATSKCIGFGL